MLLDSDVVIDLEHKNPSADAWLATVTSVPRIVGFTAMEVLNGCRNKREKEQIEKFLRPFPVVWPSEATLTRALREHAGYRLSHSLGILDALIGLTAIELGEDLATLNIKHFRALPSLKILQPYMK